MQLPDSVHAALRAAALVSQMAIATAVGAIAGLALDGWWGTAPVLVLVLGGLGFVGGLVLVWRAFQAAMPDDAEDDGHDNDPPP